VYLESPEEIAARYPVLAGLVPALSALPLIASGGTVGVLLVDFSQPRVLERDERDLLEAIAGQTAVALERAQLYMREHAVAQTLQASLLPRALPRIPGLDVAAQLRAGATGIDVGGDFYDVFAIGDGAWGLAIGDVCGKGVDAAALTALARHTIRAAAAEGHSPAQVLRALNRAVLADARPAQFLTAIFARLDGTRLTLASGGHPPPVLLGADGAMKPLACRGTLLGVLEDPPVADTVVSLEGGDTLLLYTDGLTEAGAPERTLGTEDVAALLATARSQSAAETVERVLARALDMGVGFIRDDVAVLVAQPSTAGRSRAGESSTRGQ
jgi:serine phosphatase RsbU (regulator of sigma subunit)